MLLPEILRWFYDPKKTPIRRSYWMSGHSASLLEELKEGRNLLHRKRSTRAVLGSMASKTLRAYAAWITSTRSIWEACTALYRGLDERAADSATYAHLSGLRGAKRAVLRKALERNCRCARIAFVSGLRRSGRRWRPTLSVELAVRHIHERVTKRGAFLHRAIVLDTDKLGNAPERDGELHRSLKSTGFISSGNIPAMKASS